MPDFRYRHWDFHSNLPSSNGFSEEPRTAETFYERFFSASNLIILFWGFSHWMFKSSTQNEVNSDQLFHFFFGLQVIFSWQKRQRKCLPIMETPRIPENLLVRWLSVTNRFYCICSVSVRTSSSASCGCQSKSALCWNVVSCAVCGWSEM